MNEQTTDSELIQSARRGDSAAFGLVITRHHRAIHAYLLKLTANFHDAEDLTQDTFLHALGQLEKFDHQRPLLPWLFTIARRQAITGWRKAKPLVPLDELETAASADTPPIDFDIWDLARSHLPPLDFTALWMHYQQDYPIKEIARILGKTGIHAKIILHRARKKLRKRIEETAPSVRARHQPETQIQ